MNEWKRAIIAIAIIASFAGAAHVYHSLIPLAILSIICLGIELIKLITYFRQP